MKNKKIVSMLLGGMMAVMSVMPAMAEETMLISTLDSYNIKVNEESLDLGSLTPYEKNGNVMIPLAKVAEKLGFKVEWLGDEECVKLDNGEVYTKLHINEDNYYMASSTMIGMSAPTSLGVAPEIKGDRTYVPAKLFTILYCNENAVKVNGKDISISSKEEIENVQIPNPIVEYKNIDEAKENLSFSVLIPTELPEGYIITRVSTISNEIFQVDYSNGKNEITYRMATGTEDISGDYNVYDFTEKVTFGDINAKVMGNGDSASKITWNKDGNTFSIYSQNGLTKADVEILVNGIN